MSVKYKRIFTGTALLLLDVAAVLWTMRKNEVTESGTQVSYYEDL